MTLQADYDNTTVAVVLYNPDNTHLEDSLASLYTQTSSLIIVDNGSSEQTMDICNAFANSNPGCDIIFNHKNRGLGEALNQASMKAIDNGKKWCVYFDQDSVIYSSYCEHIFIILKQLPGQYGLLGCNYLESSKNRYKVSISSRKPFLEKKTVITSGSILNLDTYLLAGPFNSDYFIDSIDHDYSLRLRLLGFKNYITTKPLMKHHIGDSTQTPTSSLRSQFSSFSHSPERKFFMGRNILYTVRTYIAYEPAWCMKQLARLLFESVSIIIFEKQKPAKLGALTRGVIAGIKGNPTNSGSLASTS